MIPGMVLEVLLFEDDEGLYNGICLQMDLVACGRDVGQVRRDLVGLMRAHIVDCLGEGRPHDILRPAPQEYWDMLWEVAVAQSTPPEHSTLEAETGDATPPALRDILKRLGVRSYLSQAPRHAVRR